MGKFFLTPELRGTFVIEWRKSVGILESADLEKQQQTNINRRQTLDWENIRKNVCWKVKNSLKIRSAIDIWLKCRIGRKNFSSWISVQTRAGEWPTWQPWSGQVCLWLRHVVWLMIASLAKKTIKRFVCRFFTHKNTSTQCLMLILCTKAPGFLQDFENQSTALCFHLFLRWFKLWHICIQPTALHKTVSNSFVMKSISRKLYASPDPFLSLAFSLFFFQLFLHITVFKFFNFLWKWECCAGLLVLLAWTVSGIHQ